MFYNSWFSKAEANPSGTEKSADARDYDPWKIDDIFSICLSCPWAFVLSRSLLSDDLHISLTTLHKDDTIKRSRLSLPMNANTSRKPLRTPHDTPSYELRKAVF